MPKRVIDFDAMWGSDKLAACAEWAQAEYAWLYGLADASGCFEVTNLRVIWGRVAAIRRNLTIERLEQIFGEFEDKGLLFVWEHEGKRYGHWTGSDVPGRLPPPSWRMRLERLAPPVPKQRFVEYVSRFARGRATLPGGTFRGEAEREAPKNGLEMPELKPANANLKSQRPDLNPETAVAASRSQEAPPSVAWKSLKDWLEKDQAQNWNLNLDLKLNREVNWDQEREGYAARSAESAGKDSRESVNPNQPLLLNNNSKPQTAENGSPVNPFQNGETLTDSRGAAAQTAPQARAAWAGPVYQAYDKSLLVAKELRVGIGPARGPVKVRPEALERDRAREAARRGSRSP